MNVNDVARVFRSKLTAQIDRDKQTDEKMKLKKEVLRRSAWQALVAEGFDVQLAPGPGIVPGARLTASKNNEVLRVAVRTSLDREVGLLRNGNGSWRTVSSVDLVLIAVPDGEELQFVDIYAFESSAIVEFFDAVVASPKTTGDGADRFRIPIFVSLDDKKKTRSKAPRIGLKSKASWHLQVPLDHPGLKSRSPVLRENPTIFFARIKREIAAYMDIDVDQVEITTRN